MYFSVVDVKSNIRMYFQKAFCHIRAGRSGELFRGNLPQAPKTHSTLFVKKKQSDKPKASVSVCQVEAEQTSLICEHIISIC